MKAFSPFFKFTLTTSAVAIAIGFLVLAPSYAHTESLPSEKVVVDSDNQDQQAASSPIRDIHSIMNSGSLNQIGLAEKSDGGWDTGVFTKDDGQFAPVHISATPPVVQRLLKPNDRPIKAIRTMGGMNAWVIQPADNPTTSLVYLTTPDDLFAFAGPVFFQNENNEMESLSYTLAQKYQPVKDVSLLWTGLENSAYISEGPPNDEKRVVYAFFDTHCNYCHLSWLALKPYVDTGEVQVRWIPIGGLTENSGAAAAQLLQSENPRTSLVRGHLTWDNENEGASFELGQAVQPETQVKLDENKKLLASFGATGVPTFIYKDDKGVVNMVSGAMRLDQIPLALGTGKIQNNDPRLSVLN